MKKENNMKLRQSPVKQVIPLTPPNSVETKKNTEDVSFDHGQPKDLLTDLRKVYKCKKKPRLKYRPDFNTLFNIDDYVNGIRSEKSSVEVANFFKHCISYSKRIIVVSGAGVSVAAGIPDFRSSDGLFSSLKNDSISCGKDLFDFNQVYSSDKMCLQFNKMIVGLHDMCESVKPTEFHKMLDKICMEGRLRRIYTQNIDNVESKLSHLKTKTPLNMPFPNTIQLHGSISYMSCMKCTEVFKMDPKIFKHNTEEINSEIIPLCSRCQELETVRSLVGKRLQGVGKLRPRIVLYNEIHPEGDIIGEIASLDLKNKPDCMIIVGTTLKIPGVKSLCRDFSRNIRSNKGIIIWISNELPSQNIKDLLGQIDLIVLGDCQNVPKLYKKQIIE